MKYIITLSCIILLALTAAGSDVKATEIAQQADSAYRAERYYDAIALYDSLMTVAGPSSAACYNMGNCCYRVNRRGEALLWYERALKLDPTNAEARANVAFVRNKLPDVAVADSNDVVSVGLDRFLNRFTTDGWAALCIAAFVLAMALAACYLFSSTTWLRKVGFFAGLVALVAAGVALTAALAQARARTARDAAIVIAPQVNTSANPRPDAPAAFTLNEGSKVHIIDSLRADKVAGGKMWLLVTPDGDKQGWVSADSVKVI